MSIGKAIKIALIYSDYTVKEMADAIDMSHQHLSAVMADKRPCNSDMLENIAGECGCSLSVMLALGETNPLIDEE